MSHAHLLEHKRDWATVDRDDYDARLMRWIIDGKGEQPELVCEICDKPTTASDYLQSGDHKDFVHATCFYDSL